MNYHGRVMNIPAHDKYAGVLAMKAVSVSYQEGHRDARHAAAEIANEADARIAELETRLARSLSNTAALETENAALKEKVAAAEDVSEAYQLELADAAERTREIEALKALDNPEFDATDAAHPAWWRGHDHTAKMFKQKLEAANARADALGDQLAERTAQLREALGRAESAEAEAGKLRQFAGKPWERLNMRRCNLIARRAASDAERLELAELQSLADECLRVLAPLPIAELEAYMREHGIEIPDAADIDAAQEGT